VELSLAITLKSAAGGRYGAGLMRAHLLHIGKTGGNALKHALHPYNTGGSHDIVFHPHAVRLSDVPVGESVLFMLRNPVNRFVSGFNSRRRRGRPLNNAEWDRNEAVAFAAFPTANDLAEALSVAQDSRRAEAVAAMRGIYHVKSSYADWLVDVDYLRSRRDDILWVGQTSRLTADFRAVEANPRFAHRMRSPRRSGGVPSPPLYRRNLPVSGRHQEHRAMVCCRLPISDVFCCGTVRRHCAAWFLRPC
jgi:hypothetical protein